MWVAADLLETTQLYHSGLLEFFSFWIFGCFVPSLSFVELSAVRATGHTHDTPAILLVLSLELRETDFDLDCPYRLPPP